MTITPVEKRSFFRKENVKGKVSQMSMWAKIFKIVLVLVHYYIRIQKYMIILYFRTIFRHFL